MYQSEDYLITLGRKEPWDSASNFNDDISSVMFLQMVLYFLQCLES